MADKFRDDIKEADIIAVVDEGKKFVDGEDYASAVDHFAKSLEELVPKYGDTHDSFGYVYFYYGRALLGFAKDEADALVENMVPQENKEGESTNSSKLDNVDEEGDEEDDKEDNKEDKDSKAAGDATTEGDKNKEPSGDTSKEEGDSKKEEAEKPSVDDAEKKDDEKAVEGEKKDDEDEEEDETNTSDDDKEDVENVDNLQLAWEILELARRIFESKGEKGKEMLLETLYCLGNVSIENENFDGAVEDLLCCANEYNVEKGSLRRHAEIHFKLALAYSMAQKFDDSIVWLNKANDTLQLRIKQLKDEKESDSEKEVKELESIITEIDIKKADVQVYKEEAHKSVLELLNGITSTMSQQQPDQQGGEGSSSKKNSPNKLSPFKKVVQDDKKDNKPAQPVNDISHLVRRNKRASDEELDADATPPKKPATEKTTK